MNNEYRICNRCIMDTSDPEITFDDRGYCNHCNNFFDSIIDVHWKRGIEGHRILEESIKTIKKECRGKAYDGIIGLSGGVDSSYLLCKTKEWGLRLLAVHVDAGWNSELAVNNIEVLCKKLNIDLHTIVIDWEAMRNVQVAFLRSGVVNQDIPQDHAFFSSLYRYAVKNGIRYVFNGSNFATESILPKAWGSDAMDASYLSAVVRRFGKGNTKKYPVVSFWDYYVKYPYIKKMTVINPLNYIDYKKTEAINSLEEYGWRYYGEKHWESHFTKFYQGYYLPKRFGFDKRRAHLSSLIVSKQMSRVEALDEMENSKYTLEQVEKDKLFVLKKLGLSNEEFDNMINSSQISDNIPSNKVLRKIGQQIKSTIVRNKR